jgi:hypothetical protein
MVKNTAHKNGAGILDRDYLGSKVRPKETVGNGERDKEDERIAVNFLFTDKDIASFDDLPELCNTRAFNIKHDVALMNTNVPDLLLVLYVPLGVCEPKFL